MTNDNNIFTLKQALGDKAVNLVKTIAPRLESGWDDAGDFIASEYANFAEATKGTILEGTASDRIFISTMRTGSAKGTAGDIHCVFVILHIIITTGGISEKELKRRAGDKYQIVIETLNIVFAFAEDELNYLISNEELHVPRLKTMIDLKYDGMPFDVSPTGESD